MERPGDRIQEGAWWTWCLKKTLEVSWALDREERIRHFSVRNEHHNQTSTDAQEQQDPPSKETPYDIT